MKDQNGLYYYPFPSNRRVRMYVRKVGDTVCFRLWSADDPTLWVDHGWVPYEAVIKASGILDRKKAKGFDPASVYDISLAEALLKETESDQD